MSATVGGVLIDMAANVGRLQDDMGKAYRLAEKFSRDTKRVLGGLAIGFSGYQFGSFVKSQIDAADKVNDLAEAYGISTEELSRYQYAAKLSGAETEQFNKFLSKTASLLVEVKTGNGDAGRALSALGVDAVKAKDGTLSLTDAVGQISDKFASAENGAMKLGTANKVFGEKIATGLVPFLNQGSAGIAKLTAESDRFGATITETEAKLAGEFNDALDRSNTLIGSTARVLGISMLPTLNSLIGLLTESGAASLRLADKQKKLFAGNEVTKWADNAVVAGAVVYDTFKSIGGAFDVVASRLAGMAATAPLIWQQMQAGFKGIFSADSQAQADSLGEQIKTVWAASTEGANAGLAKINFDTVDRVKKMISERQPIDLSGDGKKKNALDLGGMNKDADAAAKKALDNRLKEIQRAIDKEGELYKHAQEYQDRLLDMGTISNAQFFESKRTLAERSIGAVITLYDKEIAALEKAKAAADADFGKQAEREEYAGKITEVREKRERALREAKQQNVMVDFDQAKSAREFSDKLEEVNAQLFEMQGNLVAANEIRFNLQNRDFLARFGDQPGSADAIERLRRSAAQQAELNKLQLDAGIVRETASAQERTWNAQASLGYMSQLQALAKIGDARKAEYEQLSGVAEQMRAVAEASGDPRMVAGAKAFAAEIAELAAQADVLNEKLRSMYADSFADTVSKVVDGTATIGDAFRSMIGDISKQLTRLAANDISGRLFSQMGAFGSIPEATAGMITGKGSGGFVDSITSAIGSFFGGFRAAGGPVRPGKWYMTGERGPEPFIPGQSGGILPNSTLAGAGGGGVTVQMNITTPDTQGFRRSQGQIVSQLAGAVQRAGRFN